MAAQPLPYTPWTARGDASLLYEDAQEAVIDGGGLIVSIRTVGTDAPASLASYAVHVPARYCVCGADQ